MKLSVKLKILKFVEKLLKLDKYINPVIHAEAQKPLKIKWYGTMRKSELNRLKKDELNRIVTSGLIEEVAKKKLIKIVVEPHLIINGYIIKAELNILK